MTNTDIIRGIVDTTPYPLTVKDARAKLYEKTGRQLSSSQVWRILSKLANKGRIARQDEFRYTRAAETSAA